MKLRPFQVRVRKLVRRTRRRIYGLFGRTLIFVGRRLWHFAPVALAATRLLKTDMGKSLALIAIEQAGSAARGQALAVISRGWSHAERLRLAEVAWQRSKGRLSLSRYMLAVYASMNAEQWTEALDAIQSASSPFSKVRVDSQLLAPRLRIEYELARYAAGVDTAHKLALRKPQAMRDRHDFLIGAFCANKVLDVRSAHQFIYAQFGSYHPRATLSNSEIISLVREMILRRCFDTVSQNILMDMLEFERIPRIAVFPFAATEAVGHAILDPYHLLAQARARFDKIYFVGPPRQSYKPATRVALELLDGHATYVETTDEMLGGLSWIQLGELSTGSLTALVENYWSLLRSTCHRTRNADDIFCHNAWHLEVPKSMAVRAEAVCRRAGIDLERPFIVVHARDSSYHGISKQAFRDSPISLYKPAIERLLDAGYQVVRIGDRKMPRLDLSRAGYVELPFTVGYQYVADPFLISRAVFMMGCQSGPCAYARAFGVPLLTVNAVLHYTLLPSTREMACFKTYWVREGAQRRRLSLDEALARGVAFFDNAMQFAEAGIEVESASPDEIEAAVGDMLAWLADPALPETREQSAFRRFVAAFADRLARDGNPQLPIADFLGIALEGYRVSPSVAASRADAEWPAAPVDSAA